MESFERFTFDNGQDEYVEDIVADPLSSVVHIGRSETRELARSLVPTQPIWLFSGRKASHRASGRH